MTILMTKEPTIKDVLDVLSTFSAHMDEQFVEIRQDIRVLKEDVKELKQDVAVLKQDVKELKQDVAVLKQDVAILKEDVFVLKQDVREIRSVMATKSDIEDVVSKDYLEGRLAHAR